MHITSCINAAKDLRASDLETKQAKYFISFVLAFFNVHVYVESAGYGWLWHWHWHVITTGIYKLVPDFIFNKLLINGL